MNVYIINEENHSNIGVVKTIKDAIHFLITEEWLESDSINDEEITLADYLETTAQTKEELLAEFDNVSDDYIKELFEKFGFYLEKHFVWNYAGTQ